MNLKAKIEAVLFLTAKPVKAQALARIVNADVQSVRQCVLELVHDYEERQGGLEISDEDGYSFQVKEEYASLTSSVLEAPVPMTTSESLLTAISFLKGKSRVSVRLLFR